jgi:VHL beta domain
MRATGQEYSTPVQIKFINKSSTAVDIYWIDYRGNRVLKRPDLSPGAAWRIGTFVTHPWLVVASDTGGTKEHGTGVRLAGFEPSTSAGGDAIITDRH